MRSAGTATTCGSAPLGRKMGAWAPPSQEFARCKSALWRWVSASRRSTFDPAARPASATVAPPSLAIYVRDCRRALRSARRRASSGPRSVGPADDLGKREVLASAASRVSEPGLWFDDRSGSRARHVEPKPAENRPAMCSSMITGINERSEWRVRKSRISSSTKAAGPNITKSMPPTGLPPR